MAPDPKKTALRKVLLEKRDSTSYDMIKIASQKIFNRLKKIKEYRNAKVIACYYPIGSEVLTQDIMLDALSQGKQVCLPKVTESKIIEFREVKDLKSLERDSFNIMEPKKDCEICDKIDLVIVPTVGIDRNGSRLGYGHGYYDRFLSTSKAVSIALTYSKQIVKNIPSSDDDVQINWIVTEDEFFKSS